MNSRMSGDFLEFDASGVCSFISFVSTKMTKVSLIVVGAKIVHQYSNKINVNHIVTVFKFFLTIITTNYVGCFAISLAKQFKSA